MKFLIFILQFMAILFGAHYLLHLSLIHFLSISDPFTKRILARLILFLSVTFLPSAVLLRYFPGLLTRGFYLFSSTWLGLFVYLMTAICVCWLLFLFCKIFHAVPNMRTICACGIVLAVLVSLYGIWSARHPVIKSIDITINNLPLSWRNKQIVQLSDVHLGTVNGAAFMQNVASRVNKLKPELILITGDLFDGMGGAQDDLVPALNTLKAAKGVYFVTGNHEGYLGLKKPLSILRQTHIRVLDNEVVDVEGLQIVGVGYPDYRLRNNVHEFLMSSGAYDPKKPSILMYHTPTNVADVNTDRGTQQTKAYWRPDTSMSLAREAGIDLQLSGHTHQGQLFPFNLLTRTIYNGYDYGLHNEENFQLYVTSGTGTWGPPMRIGTSSEIVLITLK